MKLRLVGVVVCLAVLSMFAVPVWSQDAAQSEKTQSAAVPDAGAETAFPVRIADAVICQDVVDRTPVGSSDMFAKAVPKVFCYCRVVGARAGSRIIHNWYYNGALKASVALNVGSSDYRTWSSKTLRSGWEGEWLVEILSDDGTALERLVFIIK